MDENVSASIKTVSIVLGLVFTTVTTINGVFLSCRENNRIEAESKSQEKRLTAESQGKIREIYLNNLYGRPITLRQEEQIFKLLAKLESDKDFQSWATAEHDSISQWVLYRDSLEKVYKNSILALSKEKKVAAKNDGVKYASIQEQLNELVAARVQNLNKLGDPIPRNIQDGFTPVLPQRSKAIIIIKDEQTRLPISNAKVGLHQRYGLRPSSVKQSNVPIDANGRGEIDLDFSSRIFISSEGYEEFTQEIPRDSPSELTFFLKKK